MHFDHIALATRDATPVLNTLVGDLGGTVLQGAQAVGFRPVHLRLGDATSGMTVEVLEPYDVEVSDFLERFLQTRGEGPHHITLKTDDLARELDQVDAAGLTPVNVLLDRPGWKEAFLTPKEAHGTVVQLAEGGLLFPSFAAEFESATNDGPWAEPRWWPELEPRAAEATRLERIVMRTPTLDATVDFYTGLLGATVDAETSDSTDVVWSKGGRVRFIVDRDAPAGVSHLELNGPGPKRELFLAGTRFVINPGS